MTTLIRSLIVAFSRYSQIPTPRLEYREADEKRILVFLPWVGAVVGGLVWVVATVLRAIEAPLVAQVALVSAVPLIATGGFHVDGFMDVQDALRSYQSRAKKLEILKDPHVGAFAVIRLLIYSLIWSAALAIALSDGRGFVVLNFALSFFIVRSASGALALKLRPARRDGSLWRTTSGAGRVDFWVLVAQGALGIAGTIALAPIAGLASFVALALFTWHYRRLCYREFGGATGDTAGYYVTVGENVMLTTLAVVSLCA